MRLIEGAVRDALHAWTLAVVAHLEKQLSSLQSKYDFCPKNDVSSIAVGRQLLAPTGPSIACASVCKSVLQVFTALKDYSAQLERLNLQELFWKPLGQQFAGMLISHIKKLVVNREGSAQLLRDIAEYSKVRSMSHTSKPCSVLYISLLDDKHQERSGGSRGHALVSQGDSRRVRRRPR